MTDACRQPCLNDRQRAILLYVVESYIARTEPVGSRTIVENCLRDLSPATVRTCLAEMERLGLLAQPHHSAGRVPTDLAFRCYVDMIHDRIDERSRETELFERRLAEAGPACSELLGAAVHVLSELARQTSVMLLPRPDGSQLSAVELVRLSPSRVLAVFVYRIGIVENKVIELDGVPSQDELSRYARQINRLLERHGSIEAVRNRIVVEMRQLRTLFDRLLASLCRRTGGEDVIIEGQGYLLDSHEFADVREMRRIFRTFDEKSRMVSLLDRSLGAAGTTVHIGDEVSCGLDGMALVSAPYGSCGCTMGMLGVIGPVRMDYTRIIPLVNTAARLVSHAMSASAQA